MSPHCRQSTRYKSCHLLCCSMRCELISWDILASLQISNEPEGCQDQAWRHGDCWSQAFAVSGYLYVSTGSLLSHINNGGMRSIHPQGESHQQPSALPASQQIFPLLCLMLRGAVCFFGRNAPSRHRHVCFRLQEGSRLDLSITRRQDEDINNSLRFLQNCFLVPARGNCQYSPS